MEVSIKTDREVECRGLTITEYENLTFLIYRSSFRSYFPIAYNDKTESERFVGYAGATCSNNTIDENDNLDLDYPENVDVYICPNGFKSPYKRTADQLINLQNLIIDIDSHTSKLTIDELNEHIKDIEPKLIDKMIIKPNFVNRTGRGLHLWFCIEPCHVALNKICMSVIDMLCTHIEQILNELGETELTLDKVSSLKLNGLYRVPYTYNTKAKRWAEGYLIHMDEPHINELNQKLRSKGFQSAYYGVKSKKKKVKQTNYNYDKTKLKDNDYTPCLLHRKRFMDYLFKTRDIEIGMRNKMFFGLYVTLIMLMSTEDARAYCEELNEQLVEPLHPYELMGIFKSVKKKVYRYTVDNFFVLIDATEEEKKWFKKLTAKEEKRQQKRDEKKAKYAKIKEMKNEGMSITEIHRITKVSRTTIYNIINESSSN